MHVSSSSRRTSLSADNRWWSCVLTIAAPVEPLWLLSTIGPPSGKLRSQKVLQAEVDGGTEGSFVDGR